MLAVASEQLQAVGGVSRRDFLRLGGLSVLGLSVAEQRARAEASGKGLRRCIFILMTGGPSQFETFDPKPGAPGEVRGPFKPIATATPDLNLSETLPLLAQRSDKFAVIRSLFHDAAPIHETGQQLIQSGRLVQRDLVPPSLGSIVARLLGSRNDLPAYAVLPRPLADTGVAIWQGQRAGDLGAEFEPWDVVNTEFGIRNAELGIPAGGVVNSAPPESVAGRIVNCDPARMLSAANWLAEPEAYRRSYGESEFGRSFLAARRLVEQGVRYVTVNMYDSLAGRVTWDCHARRRWLTTATSSAPILTGRSARFSTTSTSAGCSTRRSSLPPANLDGRRASTRRVAAIIGPAHGRRCWLVVGFPAVRCWEPATPMACSRPIVRYRPPSSRRRFCTFLESIWRPA
jgi:hypothetical protein